MCIVSNNNYLTCNYYFKYYIIRSLIDQWMQTTLCILSENVLFSVSELCSMINECLLPENEPSHKAHSNDNHVGD